MLKTTFSCLKHPSHAQTVVLLFSFWNRVKDFDASFFLFVTNQTSQRAAGHQAKNRLADLFFFAEIEYVRMNQK